MGRMALLRRYETQASCCKLLRLHGSHCRLQPLLDDGGDTDTELESLGDEIAEVPRSLRGTHRPGYMPARLYHIISMICSVSWAVYVEHVHNP